MISTHLSKMIKTRTVIKRVAKDILDVAIYTHMKLE
jgi:hypothetical protein